MGLLVHSKKSIVISTRLLLKISQTGLKNRNFVSKGGYDERHYLKNIEINLENNLSPADKLINKYNQDWGKSTDGSDSGVFKIGGYKSL